MKLDRRQIGFKADEITYLDRKSILLDRAMLKLFELLRFDGRPPARWRRMRNDVDELVRLMTGSPDRFPGFAGHDELAAAWLKSDLLQVMNRGKGERETVVGPRPVHLNAYKLANPSAVADHGASDQVWALLYHADPALLDRLKRFFGPGVDPALDRYDGVTELDLETLAVLGLVDGIRVSPFTTSRPVPFQPLCLGQGRCWPTTCGACSPTRAASLAKCMLATCERRSGCISPCSSCAYCGCCRPRSMPPADASRP